MSTEATTQQLRVRAKSHAQLSSLAARHRITLIDAAELAIANFAELPVEERRARIDGEPRRKRRSKSTT